jgi:diguanylate cyclase (GGDEF)-like protein
LVKAHLGPAIFLVMAASGMIIDGVLGSEAIDSSGEILDVEGADISDVEKGTLLLNWEHEPGEKGANTIVGKVIAAKKIYSAADCENDRQLKYWEQVRLPFIYGICRLFDGAGHENAKAIAAIVRDNAAHGEMLVCRFSVEGSTLEKDGARLKASIIRRVAVTVKPCNRTANSGLVEDPHAPDGFDKKVAKEKTRDLLDMEDAKKNELPHPLYERLGGSKDITCDPMVGGELEKALSAGGGDVAPSALTGGAALSREELRGLALSTVRDYGAKKRFDKKEFRAFAKTRLPDASDDFLDHFTDVAEDYHVRRAQLAKKEEVSNEPTPAAPKAKAKAKPAAKPKAAAKPAKKPAAEAAAPAIDEDDARSVKPIAYGTIRGIPTIPNEMRGYTFDEEKGVLHTPKGSFPLYNPDRGFQVVEHKTAKKGAFYKGGVLHVAPGTDVSTLPANLANPGFREIYNSQPIEDFHSGKVMPNWTRVHELTKNGKLPEEVVMHSAVFSMLSPNTPVRPHEYMYAHMADTWEDLGVDPRDPDFKRARRHWLNKDKPTNYPKLAGDYFRNHPDIHLQNDSAEKGRKVGELKSFMLGENKFANIAQYHKLHSTLVDLVKRHGTDSRAATAELMQLKHKQNLWQSQRRIFRDKIKKKAYAEMGLRNDLTEYVDQKVAEAKAAGVMGRHRQAERVPGADDDDETPMKWDPRMLPSDGDPVGDMSVYYGSPQRAQANGDTAKRQKFVEEGQQLGLRDALQEYAETEAEKKFGKYQGTIVPGLAPKTGRFTFTMLGGGNTFVPDTHIIRHLFGMDPNKDSDTLMYLKQNVLWNSRNHHLLEAMDRWYAKNHPAAKLMQQHPTWGRHFKDDPEQANFPAFWRHWCSIASDERARGIANSAENEFSTHEPFWMGIDRYVKKSVGALDHKLLARLITLHAQYHEDHGEVPAQMMYFAHVVPHLLEASQYRERHDDLLDFAKHTRLNALEIELRKAASDIQAATISNPEIPSVHGVHLRINGKEHRAGRFMLAGGRLHILEDYHGLLEKVLPEGKVTPKTISTIHGLKMSPHLRIDVEEPAPANTNAVPDDGTVTLNSLRPSQPPRPASVFRFRRAGMDKHHTIEVRQGQYLIDGNRMSYPEVQAVLADIRTGAGEIRYPGAEEAPLERIRKMEDLFTLLMKSGEEELMDAGLALQHVRQAVASGHISPEVERALTRHIYEDPMTSGLGNKKAWTEFKAKKKPGTYIQMDGNNFKAVNDAFGHEGGDAAIKAFGRAARQAMDEAVGNVHGKLFRNGGDEFIAHVPSHEHAAKFSRLLSQKLDALPPIEGKHQLSMAYGFGHTPDVADQALYEAKKQKVHPETGRPKWPIGKVPNLAHSLVPGHEGALPLRDPPAEAIHHVLQSPAGSGPPSVGSPPTP